MSMDPSEWEILPAEEDTVFSKSPDDFVGRPVLGEITQRKRHHDKQARNRQKRFRSKHFENLQSPPNKRRFCVAKSPMQKPVNMSLDCFFHSTPKKPATAGRHQIKRTAYWQKKKPSDSCFVVKAKEMKMFFKLTGNTPNQGLSRRNTLPRDCEKDEVIHQFLCNDNCCKVADKYLLAMVFAYFKRADLSLWEYTRMNFFIALYLANDVEEDEEELKYEIFPWALGKKWKDKYPQFLKKRDKLLTLIEYKAIVSRRCSDEIMAIEPDHPLWKRDRPQHHAGAIRSYMKDRDDDGYPRGPDMSPRYCQLCDGQDSQYDSASPSSVTWCIASTASTPESQPGEATIWTTAVDGGHGAACSFDMKGLKKTLPAHDLFPGSEE